MAKIETTIPAAHPILLLFAIPFLVAGIFIGCGMLTMLSTWNAAKEWDEAKATVLDFELKVRTHSDGDLYRVICKYQYEYDGRMYISDRIEIVEMGYGDSWHRSVYVNLSRAFESGYSVPCYVDPDEPERALLDRSLDSGDVAGRVTLTLLLVAPGIYAFIMGVVATVRWWRERGGRQKCLDEPWMWKSEWRNRRIRTSLLSKTCVTWLVAVLTCGLTIPISVVFLMMFREDGGFWFLFFSSISVIGIWFLYVAVKKTAVYIRFRRSEFQLETLPAFVGEHLKGWVRLPRKAMNNLHGNLRLSCQKESKKDKVFKYREAWNKRVKINSDQIAWDNNDAVFPVSFDIPDFVTPSGKKTQWKLIMKLTLPVKVEMEFEVPVFRVKEAEVGANNG